MLPTRVRAIVDLRMDGLQVLSNEMVEAVEMLRLEPELRQSICSEYELEEARLYELLTPPKTSPGRRIDWHDRTVRRYDNPCNS